MLCIAARAKYSATLCRRKKYTHVVTKDNKINRQKDWQELTKRSAAARGIMCQRRECRNDCSKRPFLFKQMTGRNIMAIEDETVSLIGSDKVQGTAVFDADGNNIGSIERLMIEKTSGRVSYAVLSFGGFLGIGDDHYPLPWPSLKYNVELGGYQTMVTVDQIKGAPKADGDWNWADTTRTKGLDDYYGAAI
jgi:hypothetical protein